LTLANSLQSKSHSSWAGIGRSAAAEIKKPARNMSYIEARGYLCYELTYLLGGSVTFTETPMKNFVMKALEYFLPIAPICRWIPPLNSTLEQIGYHGTGEATVYRFQPEDEATVVFFVNYEPEPPASGPYLPSLFNVPQLDSFKFLRPPFGNRDEIEHVFRRGMVGRFTPIPMTEGARESMAITQVEMDGAMWEEFCRD
jgi:hypothetical protein